MSHTIAAGIEKENKERNRRKIEGWKEQAEMRYWKKLYKRADFAPELAELQAQQEKPMAPMQAGIPSLATLFPADKTLTIHAQNGHRQGGETADENGSPFRPQQSR
jgi:hypothetical protein